MLRLPKDCALGSLGLPEMAQQGSSAAETQRHSGNEARTQFAKDFSTGYKPVNKVRPAKSARPAAQQSEQSSKEKRPFVCASMAKNKLLYCM